MTSRLRRVAATNTVGADALVDAGDDAMTTQPDDDFDPFAAGELSHLAPITPEQEEIWLSIELGGVPANLAYNQPFELSLRGELDAGALRRALDSLVLRHEALRSTLGANGEDLCVAATAAFPLDVLDLSLES